MHICLKDNQYNGVEWKEAVRPENTPFSEDVENILKRYKGINLKELIGNEKKFGKFLFFPPDVAKSDLDDKDKYLFRLLDSDSEKEPKDPKFRTSNVMGFFSLRGEKEEDGEVRMQITSRFDDAEGKNNFFLHYMLQRVGGFAIAPRTSSGDESFYDFLPYLFPYYLKEACKQGVFRAYVTREYNDANVRGPIDVARHIRFNIPFNGKVAYHTREYTTDNKITQLVRHTIEYIRSTGLLILDSDARDDVGEIIEATPTYSKGERSRVIAQNLHPVTHPYYTAYEPLRILCLGILQHKKLSYGEDSQNNIAGILFDGASLWEEYLNVLLTEHYGNRLIHPNNRTGDNKQHLFDRDESDENRTIYPDFLLNLSRDKYTAETVLDAKYKPLDEKGLSRDDSYQMLSYMFRFNSKQGFLIYPLNSTDENKTLYNKKYALFRDTDITIKTIAFEIPQKNANGDFDSFCKEMKAAEGTFIDRIVEELQSHHAPLP